MWLHQQWLWEKVNTEGLWWQAEHQKLCYSNSLCGEVNVSQDEHRMLRLGLTNVSSDGCWTWSSAIPLQNLELSGIQRYGKSSRWFLHPGNSVVTNNMQVQIRVIKLCASSCKMVSAGIRRALPCARHRDWWAAGLPHGFAVELWGKKTSIQH